MGPATVIELQDVWVRYEALPALESVNLTVREGDFLGVIGPNGGGKTTLLKVILGLVEPTQGRVCVLGDVPKRTRSQIGYVPQYTQFDPAFPISVEEVVMTGRLSRRPLFRRYTAEDRQRVIQALERVGLLDQRDRQMSQLSGGQQQRVLIARALVSEPKLLLLDEPMAGVDSQSEVNLYELLQELNAQIPIILVSHDIGAISTYVKQIACVNRTLFYHPSSELTIEILEDAYQCPVEMLGHGMPHRILKRHGEGHEG